MNVNNQKIFAILLAAGNGERLNVNIPKQFICVNKLPIFFYSLITFLNVEIIDQIILVINHTFKNRIENIINKLKNSKKIKLVVGGNSRHESLISGLKFLKSNFNVNPNDLVLSHDVARPLVSKKIIENNIFKLLKKECEVTSTGLYSSDSVAEIDCNNEFKKILNREKIFLEQTPQSATFKIFSEIYFEKKETKKMLSKTNDFCELALFFNKKIGIVNGDILNFKVTTNQDLLLLKKILSGKK